MAEPQTLAEERNVHDFFSIPKQVLSGFAIAVVALCMGVYFDTKLGGEIAGGLLLRLFDLIAAIAVLKSILEWGRIRGFPVRRADGRIHVAHLIRNLSMAAVATPMLMILSGPLVMAAFQLPC